MQIPIGMVITSLNCITINSQYEISGLWYYKSLQVPSSLAEKKAMLSDLLLGKCKQLKILGNFDQISQLVMQGDRFEDAEINDDTKNFYVTLMNRLEDCVGLGIALDSIWSPQGTGIAIDTICEFNITLDALRELINSDSDFISLTIKSDWDYFRSIGLVF